MENPFLSRGFYSPTHPLTLMATGLPRHLAAASIVTTFTDIYPNSRLKSTFKCKFSWFLTENPVALSVITSPFI